MNTVRHHYLVIDDSLADARVLQSLLNRARPSGFELDHKMSAEEGQAALETGRYDCVFLDYMLDDDSGLDLLKKIRESGNDVPVIAVSGNGCEEVAVEALKLGAQDYMVKGVITPEAIERALSNAMEKVALARQLKEKRQELESFAYVAAHDLRVPLSSVHTLVTLLLDGVGGQCDEQAIKILKRVEVSTMRMSQLLDDLLDYAETGRSRKPLVPVDLENVLEVVLDNLTARIESAGARVAVTGMPTVLGDPTALTQLFQNLIANAIKFCRDRKPVVTVSAANEEDGWNISVADNGIGIAPANLERIFAPFRRLHAESEFEGSGIGLATCKRIIDQHQGEIRVESELGRGTTFFCLLPMVQASECPDVSWAPFKTEQDFSDHLQHGSVEVSR